jgi:low temperature requirement protein LtrA
LGTFTNIFAFGYGHLIVFLAIAAFGAGVDIAIHAAVHGGHSTLPERALLALPPSVYLLSLSLLNRLSWNMAFGRKMKARVTVAVLSLALALVAREAPPAVLTGGIAFLMVCLVAFEVLCCDTSKD